MIDFGRFLEAFNREFNPDDFAADRGTGLFDDLSLDSFDAFRLLLFLEDLADVPYPPDDVPHMFTVGDAYDYYVALERFRTADLDAG